jgi:hypothetical protein
MDDLVYALHNQISKDRLLTLSFGTSLSLHRWCVKFFITLAIPLT